MSHSTMARRPSWHGTACRTIWQSSRNKSCGPQVPYHRLQLSQHFNRRRPPQPQCPAVLHAQDWSVTSGGEPRNAGEGGAMLVYGTFASIHTDAYDNKSAKRLTKLLVHPARTTAMDDEITNMHHLKVFFGATTPEQS